MESSTQTRRGDFRPRFMATAVSTVPHIDVNRAFDMVLENFPEAPHFARCQKLDYRSASTVYSFEGMPGIEYDDENKQVRFSVPRLQEKLQDFYEHYLAGDLNHFALTNRSYPGIDRWQEVLRTRRLPCWQLVKGHLSGPVTLGLKYNDDIPRPIFYDETIRDVIVKTLAMKIRCWEDFYHRAAPGVRTLVQVADPQVGMLGSSLTSLNRNDVIACYNEIFGAATGLTMIHCCANTDWAALMETSVDAVHFDAYEYLESFSLYPGELARFLARGGMVGWGIVPTSNDRIQNETAPSLVERLERGINTLVARGIDRQLLCESSFILPSCATGNMTVANAEKAYRLTGEVSRLMRSRYFGK